MAMMNLQKPANIQILLSIIVSLLNAEILSPEWTTALVFDFESDTSFVENMFATNSEMILSRSIYDGSFEAFNPIKNLGGIYLILLGVFIQTAVLASIYAVI